MSLFRALIGIICVALFITGIAVGIYWWQTYDLPLAGTLLMNALPILVSLLFGFFLVIRIPPKPDFYLTGLKVCLFVISIYGLSASGLELAYRTYLPSHDARRYIELRETLFKYDLDAVAHFPEHIPAHAEHVFLYALPRTFQLRGPVLQLRYACDPTTLASLREVFTRQQMPMGTAVRKGLYLLAGERVPVPMPNDFAIYYLLHTDNASRPGVSFEQARGVAISTRRGEIVYWVQEMQHASRRTKKGLPTYDR